MVKDNSEPLNPSTADFGTTNSAVGPLSSVKVFLRLHYVARISTIACSGILVNYHIPVWYDIGRHTSSNSQYMIHIHKFKDI